MRFQNELLTFYIRETTETFQERINFYRHDVWTRTTRNVKNLKAPASLGVNIHLSLEVVFKKPKGEEEELCLAQFPTVRGVSGSI